MTRPSAANRAGPRDGPFVVAFKALLYCVAIGFYLVHISSPYGVVAAMAAALVGMILAGLAQRSGLRQTVSVAAALVGVLSALAAGAWLLDARAPSAMLGIQRSLIAADVAVGGGTVIGGGLELGLSDALTTRIGYRSASGRQQGAAAITLGASVGFLLGGMRVHVDYALDLASTELKDSTTQHVSLRAARFSGEEL